MLAKNFELNLEVFDSLKIKIYIDLFLHLHLCPWIGRFVLKSAVSEILKINKYELYGVYIQIGVWGQCVYM